MNTSALEPNACFADSRRLTGHNRFFAGTGVVLETLGPTANDAAAHERWRSMVTELRTALGWDDAPAIVRPHAGGTLLAIAAPADILFTATEVNEWAWEQASGIFAPGFADVMDSPFDQLHPLGDVLAVVADTFSARASAEKNPALMALRDAAHQHHIALLADDNAVSVGAGSGSCCWPLMALPNVESVS